MPHYHAYVLNAAGHIAGPPYQLDCDDDEAAVVTAWHLPVDYGVEVWETARLVMRLPGRSRKPVPEEVGI